MRNMDSKGEVDMIESEADSLACEALIPAEDWSKAEIMVEADIHNLAHSDYANSDRFHD